MKLYILIVIILLSGASLTYADTMEKVSDTEYKLTKTQVVEQTETLDSAYVERSRCIDQALAAQACLEVANKKITDVKALGVLTTAEAEALKSEPVVEIK